MIHLVIYQSSEQTDPLSFLAKLTGPILPFVALALFRKIHAPVFWNFLLLLYFSVRPSKRKVYHWNSGFILKI